MRAAEQSLQKANNGLHSAPLPQPRAQELLPGRAAPAQRAQSAAERAPRPRTARPERLSLFFSLAFFFFFSFSLFLSVLFMLLHFILRVVLLPFSFFFSSPSFPPSLHPHLRHLFIYLFIYVSPLPTLPPRIYLSERGAGENGAVISSRYKYRR